MTELQLIGLGTWSQRHGDWPAFVEGVRNGHWTGDGKLQPELIPARERRRAPQLVKMAVEVMHQACNMADLPPDEVAVVFSSMMGDMQITDYMCTVLASSPAMVSPTRFHNSVHNAAPGYWSIATGAFSPTTAISACSLTPSMALLDACIQAVEEGTAVLCVTQEVAAPQILKDICPSEEPFSAALLLAPADFCAAPMAKLHFEVNEGKADWPAMPAGFAEFDSNPSARLLPLLESFARGGGSGASLPITSTRHIAVRIEPCTT
jgi:hypothetical protein